MKMLKYRVSQSYVPSVLSPFRGWWGVRTSLTRKAMLAGIFIFFVGRPKPDRSKGRGKTN